MIESRHLQTVWPVRWWDEIDSTSLEASRFAREGAASPTWFAALRQTAGRGRLGRAWISEAGNLYATALAPLSGFSPELSCLSLAAGLAVRDMVVDQTQGRVIPGLKWPNDVRVDQRKLSGVLMETGQTPSPWLSIGIGVNLAFAPQIKDYDTVSLKALMPELEITPQRALGSLDLYLRQRLQQHLAAGRASIIKDWLDATDQRGAIYRAQSRSGDQIEGEFAGLDEMGQLMLKTETGEHVTISAGEVSPIKKDSINAAGN